MEAIGWIMTGFSILGTVLNIYHNKTCFYIWALTNISWIIIDFRAGIYSQAALMTVYFFLAIWGIVKWSKWKVVNP